MRIIAGDNKGVPLIAPKGTDTRPTQAKTRESLFSIIQADVPEARVLDLFAGSGALALEALSRGASEAALVDMQREAADCIRRNIDKLGMGERASLYRCDWRQAVLKLGGEGRRFDLVFLDPPYRMTDLGGICAVLADAGLLCDDALLALEHRTGTTTAPDKRFTLTREREYGDTVISFYRYNGGEPR